MLMFMARLQRQDRVPEEAALDLGATPLLVFRRITLPFLMPTILTACVIAFLQPFENDNTTFFAIGGSWTLVTEIGSRMRFGLSPMINAIGVHVPEQATGMPGPTPGTFVVKFTKLWTVTLPEGWSMLFTHPANRPDIPFRTLSGLVSADRWTAGFVHFPALWIDPDFEGEYRKAFRR